MSVLQNFELKILLPISFKIFLAMHLSIGHGQEFSSVSRYFLMGVFSIYFYMDGEGCFGIFLSKSPSKLNKIFKEVGVLTPKTRP